MYAIIYMTEIFFVDSVYFLLGDNTTQDQERQQVHYSI